MIEEAIKTLRETDFHFEEKSKAERFCKAYNMAVRSLGAWSKVQNEIMDHIEDTQDDDKMNEAKKGLIMGLRIALNIVYEHLGETKNVV